MNSSHVFSHSRLIAGYGVPHFSANFSNSRRASAAVAAFAHNQAYLRRCRPKARVLTTDDALRTVVAGKLAKKWSPAQVSRWLRRRYRRRSAWHVCAETIYEAVYRGLIVVDDAPPLRTGRTYRHKRGRGRTRDEALKQSTR